MTSQELDKIQRWCKTTRTWVKKSAALLHYLGAEAKTDAERFLLSYEAERLLVEILSEAELAATQIAPERAEECERAAKALAALLRRRRLSHALEQGNGRTDEERALFEAKAALLRG